MPTENSNEYIYKTYIHMYPLLTECHQYYTHSLTCVKRQWTPLWHDIHLRHEKLEGRRGEKNMAPSHLQFLLVCILVYTSLPQVSQSHTYTYNMSSCVYVSRIYRIHNMSSLRLCFMLRKDHRYVPTETSG